MFTRIQRFRKHIYAYAIESLLNQVARDGVKLRRAALYIVEMTANCLQIQKYDLAATREPGSSECH